MPDKDLGSKKLSPVTFYYFNLTGTESFCALLEKRFRESGHSRPLVFKEWNCYRELPGADADLIAYDGVVMSALADKGFLKPVPEGLSAGDVFPWLAGRSMIRRKLYGLPIMMCVNALICRKKDDRNIRNIMELEENTAIPMRSMLMFYYLQTVCTNLNIRKSNIRKAFENQLEGKGLSIVEILSTCPTNWGMTPKAALEWLRENMMTYYPLGVFKDGEAVR